MKPLLTSPQISKDPILSVIADKSIKVTEAPLLNGARYLTAVLPHTHSASISIHFMAGSKYEKKEEEGLAHFSEHLLPGAYRINHPDCDLVKIAVSRGWEIAISTSKDLLSLGFVCPDYDVPQALETLFEVLHSSRELQARAFPVERERILTEIAEDSFNMTSLNGEGMARILMSGTGYAHCGLGETKQVARYSAEDVIHYGEKFFCASNATIAVSGSLATIATAQRFFSHMSFPALDGNLPSVNLDERPPWSTVPDVSAIVNPYMSAILLQGLYPLGVTLDHREAEISHFLVSTLGASIHQRLNMQQGLMYSTETNIHGYDRYSFAALGAVTTAEKIGKLHEEIQKIVAELPGQLSQDRLDEAYFSRRAGYYQSAPRPHCLQSLRLFALYPDCPPLNMIEDLNLLHSITLDECLEAAQRHFRPENLRIAIFGDEVSLRQSGLARPS